MRYQRHVQGEHGDYTQKSPNQPAGLNQWLQKSSSFLQSLVWTRKPLAQQHPVALNFMLYSILYFNDVNWNNFSYNLIKPLNFFKCLIVLRMSKADHKCRYWPKHTGLEWNYKIHPPSKMYALNGDYQGDSRENKKSHRTNNLQQLEHIGCFLLVCVYKIFETD